MYSTIYSCQISIKLEFSRQIFREKNSDIEFQENPPSGVAFPSFAKAPKMTNCKDDYRLKDNNEYIL